MNRSTLRSLSVVLAAGLASLLPCAANAQGPTSGFTADEVQAEFVRQGFRVEPPVQWWTSNKVTTFRVFDSSGPAETGRVLMVLVYPDTAMADADRTAAQAREESGVTDATQVLSSGSAPHLVPGYGPSTWLQNVALVQSTLDQLGRAYATEQTHNNQVMLGSPSVEPLLKQPSTAVDADFLSALSPTTVNL